LIRGPHRTFKDLGSKDKILQKLEEIALELEGELTRLGFTGKIIAFSDAAILSRNIF